MTVKVIMERTVKPDQQEELMQLLKELRARAVHHPGYITGETLTSVDKSGSHIVISTWNSLSEWKDWEQHPNRREIMAKIEALLQEPSKVAVYMEPWAALPEGV